MVPLLLLSLLPLCQAHFFGPVAVGFGVGLVSIGREFPIATSIVSHRSSRQYSLSTFYQSTPYASFGYSLKSYTVNDHYYTPNNLAYYQPNIYHYHSTPWGLRLLPYRKKRAAENARAKRQAGVPSNNNVNIDEIDVNKISDVAANITIGFNDKIWYNDMSYKDRDDCSKRLLCELNAKYADGQPMEEDELAIAFSFGSGDEVDIGQETMDFDIAATVGKQIGLSMCERRYRRCETPVTRMLEMIRTEMREMATVEDEVKTGKSSIEDIENALDEESAELERLDEDDLLKTTTTTAQPGKLPLLFGK